MLSVWVMFGSLLRDSILIGCLSHLVGIVVSGVVQVVTDCRGQQGQKVNALHLTSEVRQPYQSIHLHSKKRAHVISIQVYTISIMTNCN